MSETNWVLESIEPKSDQLNADDMLTGPIVVTVTDVKKGVTKEQPIVVEIDGGYKPYKPCKSMRRVLVMMWGERPSEWVGKKLKLYCDQDVSFGGMKVGGIRIKSMSGITAPTQMLLTSTRGKKAAFTIDSWVDPMDERVAKAVNAFAACNSKDKLSILVKKSQELFDVSSSIHQETLNEAIAEATNRLEDKTE